VQSYERALDKRAQAAKAKAKAEARAAEHAAAEAGMLPAPRGPVMEVNRERAEFPYTLRGIATHTSAQLGDNPAPPGMKWVLVALQIRGLLKDRDMPTPDLSFSINFTWRGGCENNLLRDPYACNTETLERVSDFMPVDATSYDDPRNIDGSGVIPPGEPVDVVYRVLVPEHVDVSRSGLKYGIETSGPNGLLRFRGLPTF